MVELSRVGENEWEIPAVDGMRVPGRIFASEKLMEGIRDDDSLRQVENVAKLPGILRGSFAMPDIHRGYGFSIGGVAAFDVDEGVICPAGVGYDINCSVRLLKTNLVESDLKGREKEIVDSLARCVPSGVGRKGALKLSEKELDEVLRGGAQWAVEKGYGVEDDFRHVENEGKMEEAVVEFVSAKARGRGMNQLGSLGAGNHFLDVLVVDEVFDEEVAEVFGLERGEVVIMIHCGSRGLGHQVASDYIRAMSECGGSDFENLGGSQSEIVGGSKTESSGGSLLGGLADFAKVGLACAPINSEIGKKYFGAMMSAANFAFANKQVISYFVNEEMKKFFPEFESKVVYEVCHNIAKFERHLVDGENRETLIIRKGATRAFGEGSREIPEDYREVGQPVLLPGSMGSSSYVLVGTNENETKSFGSCAHGAGRCLSRSEACEKISFSEAVSEMEKRKIFVKAGGIRGMVEESPFSYKDIEEVVRVCDEVGLGRKVARMRPVLVVVG